MDRTNGNEFLTLTAAANRVGLARQTLSGRVRLGLLPAFSDPRDRRFVLLKVSDLERMSEPQPRVVAAAGQEAAGAA